MCSNSEDSAFNLVIVGGGASGALVLTRLLESGFAGRILLVERTAELGKGIAYSTPSFCHLLNVRAGKMSAYPERPDHFVQWLEARKDQIEDIASSFISRKVYGEYLTDICESACQKSPAEVEILRDVAVEIAPHGNGFSLGFEHSSPIFAKRVVLAIGHPAPSVPAPYSKVTSEPTFVANPWNYPRLREIPSDATLLLVGTGLTMVDLVLDFTERGHGGRILARSRRGLLPQPHNAPVPYEGPVPASIEELVEMCRAAGPNWRSVFDSIRSRTPSIWQALTWEERARITSRLMTYWDVHRHRNPESTAQRLADLQRTGRLSVGKGRALDVLATIGGFEVQFETETVHVEWIVNCTGPAMGWQGKSSLLDSGVRNGLFEYDPLGMGLLVEDDGRLDAEGKLWALGPICRGCRLETTAMPEIREQAKVLAEKLADVH